MLYMLAQRLVTCGVQASIDGVQISFLGGLYWNGPIRLMIVISWQSILNGT